MKPFVTRIALGASLLVLPALAYAGVAAANPSLHEYKTSSGAQRHCPNDTVVWLNTDTNVYHAKSDRYYHKTKNGAFVCEKEAIKAGARPSATSQ